MGAPGPVFCIALLLVVEAAQGLRAVKGRRGSEGKESEESKGQDTWATKSQRVREGLGISYDRKSAPAGCC